MLPGEGGELGNIRQEYNYLQTLLLHCKFLFTLAPCAAEFRLCTDTGDPGMRKGDIDGHSSPVSPGYGGVATTVPGWE